MDVTLVVNRSAGGGDHSRRDLRRRLEAEGHRVEMGPRRGKRLRRALRRPADLVVVAGGDGTVGRVIKELAGRRTPLAILPLGTANNIATSLGIQGTPEELMARWRDARPMHVDVGRVRGPWGEVPFVESVGVGLLARLMSPAVEAAIADVDDARAKMTRLVRSMRLRPWRVKLDDQDRSGEYLLIEAMNIRCAGPNFCLATRSQPAGGRLQVVFAGERDRALIRALVGREAEIPASLPPRAGRRLTIWCKRQDLHVDDTHGRDLWDGGGIIRVDVELDGGGVDILV
ncbi:MAG: diacylglycerol/lipid kinase family protein [Gemmatimonadales bacterium]